MKRMLLEKWGLYITPEKLSHVGLCISSIRTSTDRTLSPIVSILVAYTLHKPCGSKLEQLLEPVNESLGFV